MDSKQRPQPAVRQRPRQPSAEVPESIEALQRALAATRSRLDASQRLAHVGSWELDVPTSALWWSAEVYRMFGVDPARFEASYDAFLSAIHPEDRGFVTDAYARSVAERVPYDIVHRLQMADGTIKYVRERCQTTYAETGEPLRSIGTVQDITERRHAAKQLEFYAHDLTRSVEELHLSEQRMQSILDNTPALISLKRPDGRYTLVNRRFEQVYGVDRADVLGKTDGELFPPTLADALRRDDAATLASDVAVTGDAQVTHGDGVHDYLSIKFGVRNAAGATTGVCDISTDITDRKRAEVLRHGQQEILEQISRGDVALDEILYNITLFAETFTRHFTPSARATILRRDGEFLWTAAAPSLPRSYTDAVDPVPIGPMAGSCGTAAFTKRRVIVADFQGDPRFTPYLDALAAHGLRACWSEPVLDPQGDVLGTFALYRDEPGQPGPQETALIKAMTQLAGIAMDRDRQQRELSRAGAEWTQAMDQLDDGICLIDAHSRVKRANSAFFALTKTRAEDVVGGVISEVMHHDHPGDPCVLCRAHAEQREGTFLLEADDPANPTDRPVTVKFTHVRDDRGQVMFTVASVRDLTATRAIDAQLRRSISKLEASQARLKAAAHHDPLTGLPNRLLLEDRLSRAAKRAKRRSGRFAVVFLDLDHFKHVNDSYGHAVGDDLLRHVAQRLVGAIRESDTIARIGGDEFVVLLDHIAVAAHAAIAAQKLLAALVAPLRIEPGTVQVSCSLGISLYPEDGTDPATLLRHADAAMYNAKQHHRGGYSFFDGGSQAEAGRVSFVAPPEIA